jgi:hypothetical protein
MSAAWPQTWRFAGGFVRPFACPFAAAIGTSRAIRRPQRDRGLSDFPTSPRHLEVSS